MKTLKKIIDFYVFSNLHVSLSVACLVLVSGKLFEKVVFLEATFLGCLTFTAYHIIRYANRFKYGKTHMLDAFSNQYKNTLWILNGFAIAIVFFIFFKLHNLQVLRLAPFGLITLSYAFSFFKIHGKKYSIRYIPGLKIFIIALVWAGSVTFFSLEYNQKTILYFLELILFVIVLTLPFDIRDMDFDAKVIDTIPRLLGVKATKYIGATLLILSCVLHIYTFGNLYLFQYLFISSILLLLLQKSTSHQSKYFSALWVEALPIFYYVITLISFK